MIDMNTSMILDHLEATPNVTFHCLDINSPEVSRLIHDGSDNGNKFVVIVGVHLCGVLSHQAIRLYRELPPGRAALVCPSSLWPSNIDFKNILLLFTSIWNLADFSTTTLSYSSLRHWNWLQQVVCPCCLPHRKHHRVFGYSVRNQARSVGIPPYQMWCTQLYLELKAHGGRTNMLLDTDMADEVNTFLTGCYIQDEAKIGI